MAESQMLNVDVEELLARASELEAPIPPPPAENPQAPCALLMAQTAAKQLGLSADNIRTYLHVGVEREWRKLAESLRNAAKAYEDVDQAAVAAINTGSDSAWTTTPGLGGGDVDAVTLEPTPVAAGPGDDYQDLKQRAWDLEQTDQGAAFDTFAEAWEAYQQTLIEAQRRFRPFQHWDGEATATVEQNFNSQRDWLASMAELCMSLAGQARDVASTQRWALEERVGPGYGWRYNDLIQLDEFYQTTDAVKKGWVHQQYARLQKLSDETMAGYRKEATLRPVNPPAPPPAHRIDPPGDGGIPAPGGGLPSQDPLSDLTGMPSMPSVPTLPSTPDAALPDALMDPMTEAPPVPSAAGSAGLKPASVGAGVPSMPLQPPVEAGSVPPAAGRDLGGLGRGVPGGAMGGGGMGMPPAGAGGGKGQGGGKGKRVQGEEESLYTEERAWTQGVIGRRRPPKDEPRQGKSANPQPSANPYPYAPSDG